MRLQPRPPEKNPTVAYLTFLVWLLLSLLWIYAVYLYINLPAQIPVQFNFSGKSDRFGHKFTLFLLPLISSFIVLSVGVRGRKEHLRSDEGRKSELQAIISGYLKIAVIILSFIVLFQIKRITENPAVGWAGWMPLAFVVLLIIPVLITLIYKRR